MRPEFAEKFLPARFRTFHKDFHILCIILNPPRQDARGLFAMRQTRRAGSQHPEPSREREWNRALHSYS